VENRHLVIETLTDTPDGPPVMRRSGPLVRSRLSEFQTKVFRALANLILDISDVPYMDSSGIAR
jgi:anti-anti-sigma regulatory factor